MADPALQAAVEAAHAVSDPSTTALASGGTAVTVLLGWFGYITKRAFGITIPRLSNEFRQALEKSNDAFREALAEQRKDFRAEMHDQRENFRSEIQRDRVELGAKLERLSTAVERMDQTLRQAKA